jgi:asparagine synthetase B (glutamine-hydrolysing)
MRSANGRFVFVFNGEIYNHLSLRRELDGTRVVDRRGTSDTERLALGVASTLQKTVGMFAFALWDGPSTSSRWRATASVKSRSTMASSGAAQRLP